MSKSLGTGKAEECSAAGPPRRGPVRCTWAPIKRERAMQMRTREEHLKWCKERANEYLARGDISNGITSMLSDLDKHPETKTIGGWPVSMLGMLTIMGGDLAAAKCFVEGFR